MNALACEHFQAVAAKASLIHLGETYESDEPVIDSQEDWDAVFEEWEQVRADLDETIGMARGEVRDLVVAARDAFPSRPIDDPSSTDDDTAPFDAAAAAVVEACTAEGVQIRVAPLG